LQLGKLTILYIKSSTNS